MPFPCNKFTQYLSKKIEHLDLEFIRTLHPIDTWVGHVATEEWKPGDGVEHTFDRLENVFPDLRGGWEDVTTGNCIGTPCHPSETEIGWGFTRASYKLQRKAYNTKLICFDDVLSVDRVQEQFTQIVRNLRRCSSIISSHRLRTEGLRVAGKLWILRNNTLVSGTGTWNADMTQLTISAEPTSKLTASHLQRRVQPQIRYGALGEELNKGGAPMLEYVTSMDEIWNLSAGNPALSDHWNFQEFEGAASAYTKYGWSGKVGNFALRDDTFQLRFNINRVNADGSVVLDLVFPYQNIAATEGIKEDVNTGFDSAPVKIDFIWHRMGMVSKVRTTQQINPMMPFAARDFAGKWQFVMDNLTCGTVPVLNNTTGAVVNIPIPVDNKRRNQGQFIADFSFGTQGVHPEFIEAFVALRDEACIVDVPKCQADPGYPAQHYSSANDDCPTASTTITFTPVLNSTTNTYEILRNTIQCNGVEIVHEPITGTKTLATLVDQLNSLVSPLGTWAVSGGNITLEGTTCTTAAMPWTIA